MHGYGRAITSGSRRICRRMKRHSFVVLAAVLAAACNVADNNAAAQASQGVDRPAPAPAVKEERARKPSRSAGYDWSFRIDEEVRSRPAILAYERSNTDDQRLNFTCEEGGARVFAGIAGGPANLRGMTLVSGDQKLQLGGKTEQTEIPEMPSFTSDEIPGDSLFLKAFAANGWMIVTIGDAPVDMVGSSSGTKAISDFVAHCNAG